jgi:hypothetical protein
MYSFSEQKPITRSNPGAVIPAAIKEHHFASGRQLGDVPLKIPLRFFFFCRCAECNNAADAGVERVGDSLDGATLAGGVAALEDDHDSQALVPDPLLQFDQLDLEAA